MEIIIVAMVFMILIGFQYTLNKILLELKEIRNHLERLLFIKKDDREE